MAEDEEHDFVLFVSGLRFTAQTDLIGRVNLSSATMLIYQPTESFNVEDGRREWTVTHPRSQEGKSH